MSFYWYWCSYKNHLYWFLAYKILIFHTRKFSFVSFRDIGVEKWWRLGEETMGGAKRERLEVRKGEEKAEVAMEKI